MTEEEWNACGDPFEMLSSLRTSRKASDRKLRLFAAACVRRVWHLLTDERSRKAVETAEGYADGALCEKEMRRGNTEAKKAHRDATRKQVGPDAGRRPGGNAALEAAQAAWSLTRRPGGMVGEMIADTVAGTAASAVGWGLQGTAVVQEQRRAARRAEERCQAALLRDIFGPLPFRPVTLPPSVRTWNEGTIPKLAEAAYQERSLPSGELDRHRLAVLADALEEVGADDLLLEHLRGPGPRVRGDWVVDLLTGRE